MNGWKTRREAAHQINVSERTLARWATRRLGPPYAIVGGRAMYREASLHKWLLDQEGLGPRTARGCSR